MKWMAGWLVLLCGVAFAQDFDDPFAVDFDNPFIVLEKEKPPAKKPMPPPVKMVLTNGVTEIFPVQPSAFESIVTRRGLDWDLGSDEFVEIGGRTATVKRGDAKTFFEELGVPFPQGASITYNPTISSVIVFNTKSNMEIFRNVLAQINVVPSQIQIGVAVVEFPKAELALLTRKGDSPSLSQTALKEYWKSGKGKLIKSGRLVTRAGLNAVTEAVNEVRYPLTYADQGKTNAAPLTFATQEEGLILNITPAVGPDSRALELTLSLEWSKEGKWTRHHLNYSSTTGQTRRIAIEQPVFHKRRLTSSIVVDDGETIVIGGSDHEQPERMLFFFITPSILMPNGTPLRDYGRPPRKGHAAKTLRVPENLETRLHRILPATFEPIVKPYKLVETSHIMLEIDQDKINAKIREYFEFLGVTFPERTTVDYQEALSSLLITTSPKCHKQVEKILRDYRHIAFQVEIDTSFVAFRQSDVLKKDNDAIKKLWRQGSGEWLGYSKLVTRTGMNAIWASVAEIIYPKSRMIQPKKEKQKALPIKLTTRAMGTIVNITPTVGPGRRLVELTLSNELNTGQTWKKINPDEPPLFHSNNSTTSILLKNGETLVLGSSDQRVDSMTVYMFITAHILDAAGQPFE